MARKKYGFVEGWRGKGNPQAVGEELEKLRKKHKKLTTEIVVKEAKHKKSPLHQLFPWDDARAAHLHRLKVARTIIRAVVVIEHNKRERVYALTKMEPDKAEGEYETMIEIRYDVDKYQSAIALLSSRVTSAVQAVHELQTIAGRSKQKGKVAVIGIVMKSLQTAETAIQKLA